MTRYHVRHTTVYEYSWAVDLSQHVLHLTPRDQTRQRVRSARIVSEPGGYAADTIDYFGNAVRYLEISAPHNRFEVTLHADVEVDAFVPPTDDKTPAWESVRDMLSDDGFPDAVAESEFALPSPLAAADAAMLEYARASFPKDRPILAGLRDLTHRIFTEFRYDPAATEVFTAVGEVMAKKAGVCQDFAHLQIAMLRALGLAARYVSGYIRTYPSKDAARARRRCQSRLDLGLVRARAWLDRSRPHQRPRCLRRACRAGDRPRLRRSQPDPRRGAGRRAA